MRVKKPIIFIDAYYDADGEALCPMATGFTHHISPWGDIEPCPIIQFSKDSIHDERPLREVFNDSEFLRDFRESRRDAHARLHRPRTPGCDESELVDKHSREGFDRSSARRWTS